jgi:hypothetical protein
MLFFDAKRSYNFIENAIVLNEKDHPFGWPFIIVYLNYLTTNDLVVDPIVVFNVAK